MGAMKENEKRRKGRKNSVATLLKLLFISSLFLFASMNNATIMGEGFFIVDEVNSISINEGEPGTVLCIQDNLLYLYVVKSYSKIIQIIDVQQPENTLVVGSYELEDGEWLRDFKISENIAYMLIELPIFSLERYFIALVNITDLTNPVRVGSSALADPYLYGADYTEIISVYKNYTYVSGLDKLVIFDCNNLTLPVKVANYASTGGDLHINNDYLYVVWNGVTIYSLADPVNPVFLGEVNSAKSLTTGSGLYGNYVINAFQESGIQSFNCTNPMQPTICGDYDFPEEKLYIERNIQDMELVEDRLFTGGRKLYIFDISEPQNLKMIAQVNVGDQNFSRITVANNYLYLTFPSKIGIYSYVENSIGRNLGLGIFIGLPIVVVASLLILRKKRS